GMPGWPLLAAWTASAARKRRALARSRRLGVVMAWGDSGSEAAASGGRTPIFPDCAGNVVSAAPEFGKEPVGLGNGGLDVTLEAFGIGLHARQLLAHRADGAGV